MPRDLTILLPPNLRPSDWARAHQNGEAPGLAPYGLNLLADQNIVVDYDSARPAGRHPRNWAGIARPSRLRRSPGRETGRAAMAWDENMAVPLLARLGDSGRTLATGVIWATDRLERGRTDIRDLALRRVLQQMDIVWCLSRGQLPLLRSWLDIDPDRVAFLPFGIDTDFYAPRPWPTRPMVLSLGNDQDRDTETLYAALAQVHAARPDARLIVQTRSPCPAPTGVEVITAVETPRLLALYQAAAVVVVATRPNVHVSGMTVCLEAGATGRPSVLSRTDGAADYVLDQTTGVLVTPGDPADHARAILSLLDDPDLAAQLGRNAREHVVTHHDQSVMCRSLATLIFGARS